MGASVSDDGILFYVYLSLCKTNETMYNNGSRGNNLKSTVVDATQVSQDS